MDVYDVDVKFNSLEDFLLTQEV